MALSKTLLPLLLSLFLALVMLTNNVRSQGDVTSFQIDSFEPNTKGLTYERNAVVPSGSSFLSLIGADESGNPLKSSVGRVLYSTPVNLWESGRQSSFETTIRYLIRTYNNNPADGMTFFIVPVNSTKPTGGEGGSLGIFSAVVPGSPIFAVEFDIYVNEGNDPNFQHIGIDINSGRSSNVTSFEGSIDQVTTVRINYDAPTRRIDVVASYASGSYAVNYIYDLKTLLPQQVQVGISASTGPTLVADFNIYSWYFTSSLVSDNNNNNNNNNNNINNNKAYIREVVM